MTTVFTEIHAMYQTTAQRTALLLEDGEGGM